MKRLTLPANTEYVRIGDIPGLTAGARHPIPVKNDETTEDGACIGSAWLDAVVLNDFCRRDHENALNKAIRDGVVTPLNEVSLVARHVNDGEGFLEHKEAITLIADFKRFAESLHIEVVNSDDAPGKASKVDAKKEKIRAILGKIEAADCEFSRDAMQGRKADFFNLCKTLERESFAYISQATFDDYLPGLCKFMPGARETDYYRDIAAKLG